MTFGEQIAHIRKEKGLTQASLAQMAGVSTSAIAMYETNRRQPDTMTIYALAKALKVRTEMFGISTQPPVEEPVTPVVEQVHTPAKTNTPPATTKDKEPQQPTADNADAGWTNLALARDEARFILFMRMHPDSKAFLQSYVNADEQKRKQIEKALRLIQAFQA